MNEELHPMDSRVRNRPGMRVLLFLSCVFLCVVASFLWGVRLPVATSLSASSIALSERLSMPFRPSRMENFSSVELNPSTASEA